MNLFTGAGAVLQSGIPMVLLGSCLSAKELEHNQNLLNTRTGLGSFVDVVSDPSVVTPQDFAWVVTLESDCPWTAETSAGAAKLRSIRWHKTALILEVA